LRREEKKKLRYLQGGKGGRPKKKLFKREHDGGLSVLKKVRASEGKKKYASKSESHRRTFIKEGGNPKKQSSGR